MDFRRGFCETIHDDVVDLVVGDDVVAGEERDCAARLNKQRSRHTWQDDEFRVNVVCKRVCVELEQWNIHYGGVGWIWHEVREQFHSCLTARLAGGC